VEDPAGDARQNVLGSINLLECARKHSVQRFIYASTGGGVYGEPDCLPVAEDHPIRPLCPYGVSKYAVEKYLELYGRLYALRFVILRYANVYGPRQNPKGEAGVVAIFSTLMLQGRRPRIFGDGTKTRDYVFVDDVVEANLLALRRCDGGVYNVGTGRRVTDECIYQTVRAAVGMEGDPIYADFQPGEVRHICLSATRIQRAFGWTPRVSLEEGVPRAVAYYRNRLKASAT
jgi:UDP-glucose 4-epimerase